MASGCIDFGAIDGQARMDSRRFLRADSRWVLVEVPIRRGCVSHRESVSVQLHLPTGRIVPTSRLVFSYTLALSILD
jgi:hypothetical protein